MRKRRQPTNLRGTYMVNPFQFVILVLSLDSERKGRNLEIPQLGDLDDLSRGLADERSTHESEKQTIWDVSPQGQQLAVLVFEFTYHNHPILLPGRLGKLREPQKGKRLFQKVFFFDVFVLCFFVQRIIFFFREKKSRKTQPIVVCVFREIPNFNVANTVPRASREAGYSVASSPSVPVAPGCEVPMKGPEV